MLLPTPRLLVACAVVATLGTVAGPLRMLAPIAVLTGAVVLLVAIIDLAWSLTTAVVVEPLLPDTLRLSRNRPGLLPLVLRQTGPTAINLRVGLGLPRSFETPVTESRIALPEEAKTTKVDWEITARKRGRFDRILVALVQPSRLGFWELGRRYPVTCDIRVYPNLHAERKQTAALFLARNQIGARVQRTMGRGRDFEKLREYLPGDGFDEIHWKASAKRNRPITKVFRAEQTQEIYVLIDASRLSGRRLGSADSSETLLERYLVAAQVLHLAAEQQDDRFGLGVFASRLHTFVRAGHGESQRVACREALCEVTATEEVTDLPEVLRALRMRIRRRSLLFILTDLTDPVLADSYETLIRPLARQHVVFINQIPAPGIAPLFSGNPVSSESELLERLAGHVRWEELRRTQRQLKAQGATATVLTNETLAAQLVSQYLDVKRRQLL